MTKDWKNQKVTVDFETFTLKCGECLVTEKITKTNAEGFVGEINTFRNSHKVCRFDSIVKSHSDKIKGLKEELDNLRMEKDSCFDEANKARYDLSLKIKEIEYCHTLIGGYKKREKEGSNFNPGDKVTIFSDKFNIVINGEVESQNNLAVFVRVKFRKNEAAVSMPFYKEQLRHVLT